MNHEHNLVDLPKAKAKCSWHLYYGPQEACTTPFSLTQGILGPQCVCSIFNCLCYHFMLILLLNWFLILLADFDKWSKGNELSSTRHFQTQSKSQNHQRVRQHSLCSDGTGCFVIPILVQVASFTACALLACASGHLACAQGHEPEVDDVKAYPSVCCQCVPAECTKAQGQASRLGS